MTKAPIPITITKLEMHARPPGLRANLPHADKARAMLLRVDPIPLHFYRYLYNTVGEQHVWVDRRRMDDAELAATVQAAGVEVYVLYVGGAPAGYAELDFRNKAAVELAYFGLIPDFIGRGFGTFLLATAIDIAWSRPIERLWVQTNTLDHPRALPLYQKQGFVPFAQEKTEIVPID